MTTIGTQRRLDVGVLTVSAGVAALYFIAAKAGLSLAFATKQVTAVWPPTGIAFAAYVLFGVRRVWPGVLLGAFLANATADEPLVTAAGIAVGNSLAGVVGLGLVRRVVPDFQRSLGRVRDILALVVLGGATGCVVSASGGVASLALAGIVPWSAYLSVWWVWWIGDTLGVLLFAPFLLAWWDERRPPPGRRRLAEWSALFAGLAAMCHVTFSGLVIPTSANFHLPYAVFPFVIWAGLRFGQREATSASVLVSWFAIWGTVHDRGPFASGTLDERLVVLEVFMGVTVVTALTIAAITNERRRAERGLEQARDELDVRVRERTAELDTALRDVREKQALLAATLDHTEDGIVLLDSSFRVLLVNGAYAAMFGLPKERLARMSRDEFFAHLVTLVDEEPAEFLRRLTERRDLDEEYVLARPRRRVVRRTEARVSLPMGDVLLVNWRDVTAERDLLAERDRQLSVDPLTGIANRRAAETALELEDARRKRSGTPLCVAVFDVDHFKRVNDLYGHATGDEVLRIVATTLSGEARVTDHVARWGGEEFLAVLPVSLEGAVAFCERAREAVAAVVCPQIEHVTISAGVAGVASGETPAEAIARADERLYQAKRGGRNRVIW
jgi:diguanylate cyclase (GGDEF)-like protein/PAS domain S-box-containing protein